MVLYFKIVPGDIQRECKGKKNQGATEAFEKKNPVKRRFDGICSKFCLEN
jgi:hypothetical protein